MKFKPTVILATFVVTMGLLLGASAAQAATVDLEDATAVRINNLEVDGTLYNVTFTAGNWPDAYGGPPPQLDVTAETAADFIEEINKALNDSIAIAVGEPGSAVETSFYTIATAWDEADESWVSWLGGYHNFGRFPDGEWSGEIDGNQFGGTNSGATGSMWTNITQVQEPGPATLISPKGAITEITPTYTWNAVATAISHFLQVREGAETYIFEWYTAEEANCEDGTGECSVTPETELADGFYNWRILPLNEFGFGPWSDPLNFNVNTTGPNVIVDENGNVTRIENLLVVDGTTGVAIIYNVSFVYDTAINVYGSDLNFPFTAPEDDETIFGALKAVTDVLNAEDTIPPGASSQGTGQFFIGYKETLGPIVAVGGENIAGVWDQCETDCTNGVALQDPFVSVPWADFDRVVDPNVVQIFRTSSTYRGDFAAFDPNGSGDGLAGADAMCQERADDAGLTGTWRAWLSDDNADAIDRIPDGEYQLVDGTVIADDKADLTDGFLKAPISLNEFGSPEEGYAWTGTQPDGTATETNCSNWTNNSGSGGCNAGDSSCGVAGFNSKNPDWTQFSENGFNCNELLQLHCFGSGK